MGNCVWILFAAPTSSIVVVSRIWIVLVEYKQRATIAGKHGYVA